MNISWMAGLRMICPCIAVVEMLQFFSHYTTSYCCLFIISIIRVLLHILFYNFY